MPRSSPILGLLSLLVVLAWLPPAHAQDWSADGGSDRTAEIVRRYREILERRPEEGAIFDRLLAEVGSGRGLERLTDEYREMSDEEPDNYAYAMLLGHLLKHQEQLADAQAAYERALEAAPEEPMVYMALGGIYRRLEDRTRSEEMYEQALELTDELEDQRDILRELADLSFEAREWEEATAYVQRLVDLEPDNNYVRMELAEIFLRYERYDEALEQYQAIVDGAGRDTRQRAVAMKDIGDVYALMGRTEDAVSQYRDAMRLIEPGYWLYRELEQRIVAVYRADNRLDELVAEFETEWRNPSFDQLLLLASLYDEIGREDDALQALRDAVRRNGRSIDARLALIRVLERQGETEAVLEEYNELIRQNPGDSSFRFRVAEIYRRQGLRDEALEVIDEVAARFASQPGVLIEAADRYMRLREGERAGEIYERLVRIQPDEPNNYVALGEYHFMEGRRSEAERTWREILEVVDDPADAHAFLGDVFGDHGLTEEAIIEYETAYDLRPTDEGFMRNLARLYQDGRRLPQALRLWEDLLESTQQEQLRAEARPAIIAIYQELGRLQDVMPDFREDFESEPPDIEAGYLLGLAYVELENLDAAEAHYRAMLDVNDEDLLALLALEDIYDEQNRVEETIEVLQRIAELSPQRAREYYHRLAELSLRMYDDDAALGFARLAVELNPDDASAQARLADILRQMQDLDGAVVAYRQALLLDPRAFPFYFDLADVYLAMDEVDEALALYQQIVEETNDEVQILRAGRRAVRIHQAAGTLGSFIPVVEPHVYDSVTGAAHLKLLVELYDALTTPLARTAEYGSPDERQVARQELDDIGRRALRPLLDALAGDDLSMRGTALRILSAIRNPGAALPVARLLDDSDSSLRLRAALAVARMADARAAQTLMRAVEAHDGTLKTLAVWALGRADAAEAIGFLEDLVADTGQTAQVRAVALIGLGRASAPLTQPEVVRAALFDEDASVQLAAVWAAGMQGIEESRPDLHTLLEHGRGATPGAAAGALCMLSDDMGTTDLLSEAYLIGGISIRSDVGRALAWSQDADVRLESLERFEDELAFYSIANESFDTDRYVSGAVRLALSPDSRADSDVAWADSFATQLASSLTRRDAAQITLLNDLTSGGRLCPTGICDHLADEPAARLSEQIREAIAGQEANVLSLLDADEPRLRQEAVGLVAAARLGGASAIGAVEEALDDPDEGVVCAALDALAALEARSSAMRVSALLEDERWSVRAAAARAAAVVVGESSADRLERLALEDAYLSVRIAALNALVDVAPARAAEVALRLWPGAPAQLRLAIVDAADALPEASADAVIELGWDDPDTRVRRLARN